MKRLLGVLILCFLISENTYAESKCTDDIEFNWSINPNGTQAHDYRKGWVDGAIHFKFKNPTSRTIKIVYVSLKTEDREIMIEEKNHDLIIDPFTKFKSIAIKKGSLMTELAKIGSFKCVYVSAGTTSKSKKSKSNKSPTNNWVVPSSSDASIWLWVGLGIAFLIIIMMAASLDNQSSSKKKLKKVDKQTNISTGQNIIEKVWSGNETMAKTFWLYCILVSGVFSFIGGMLMPIIGIFVFIVPAIVIVWANIGLWNSSTNYKLVQLNKKQSYGWATAAKVFVVLNFITTLSQAGFLLRGF